MAMLDRIASAAYANIQHTLALGNVDQLNITLETIEEPEIEAP